MSGSIKLSRRSLLRDTAHSLAGAGVFAGLLPGNFITEGHTDSRGIACDGEILGQGALRYRANRDWGDLDRAHYPVKDCHGMTAVPQWWSNQTYPMKLELVSGA
jgi:hypothetical protein